MPIRLFGDVNPLTPTPAVPSSCSDVRADQAISNVVEYNKYMTDSEILRGGEGGKTTNNKKYAAYVLILCSGKGYR